MVVICSVVGFLFQNKQPTAVTFPVEVAQHIPEKYPEYSYDDFSKEDQRHIDCLTKNIYYEAGGEGYFGMKAVGLVTMNRVEHPKFPKTVCEVVQQKRGNVCQFSWYCTKKALAIHNEQYRMAQNLAITLYVQRFRLLDITEGALFFHANYVNPYWSRSFRRTTQIGNHIFYAGI